jgi:hypothetical protein
MTCSSNGVQEVFEKTSELVNDEIIVRPNCKFCNHPARFEAEEIWAKRHNFSAIARFFDEYHGNNPGSPKMSVQNVKAHIESHYEQQMRRIHIREYGERLSEFMQVNRSNEQRCIQLLASLELQLIEVASDPTLDKIKQADAMVKMTRGVTDLLEAYNKITSEIDPARILLDKLKTVFDDAIRNQDREDVKNILLNVVGQLEDSTRDVVIETVQ